MREAACVKCTYVAWTDCSMIVQHRRDAGIRLIEGRCPLDPSSQASLGFPCAIVFQSNQDRRMMSCLLGGQWRGDHLHRRVSKRQLPLNGQVFEGIHRVSIEKAIAIHRSSTVAGRLQMIYTYTMRLELQSCTVHDEYSIVSYARYHCSQIANHTNGMPYL